jgi:hypothetical protein
VGLIILGSGEFDFYKRRRTFIKHVECTPTLQCSLPETLDRCEHTQMIGSIVQGMIFARAGGLWSLEGFLGLQSRHWSPASHTHKNQTITIIPITTADLFNCRNTRWKILCLVVRSVTDDDLITRQNAKHVTQLVRPMTTLCNVQSTPTHYYVYKRYVSAIGIYRSVIFLDLEVSTVSLSKWK